MTKMQSWQESLEARAEHRARLAQINDRWLRFRRVCGGLVTQPLSRPELLVFGLVWIVAAAIIAFLAWTRFTQ